ncbi:MAG: radical SAM protein [Deltaproteobacteria bacterium]|jgi:anaerobic ribonucleoside-triphosphate reductase activating protein|nr:radical SAM protein [Deltaproteobacteria bacterium]
MPFDLKPERDLGEDLNVGLIHAPLTALGPGVRVGIWLTGCSRGCPGCLSPDFFKPQKKERQNPLKVAATVLATAKDLNLTALTISGGEPFSQPKALKEFLTSVRANGLDDVLVYSGYLVEELLVKWPWLPKLTTAIVDGPYLQNEPSTEIFRGSKNQKLTVFDPAFAGPYAAWAKEKKHKAQFLVGQGQIRILGIPKPGDYEKAYAAAAKTLKKSP